MKGWGIHRFRDCLGEHVWKGWWNGKAIPTIIDCTRLAGHALPALVALPFVVHLPTPPAVSVPYAGGGDYQFVPGLFSGAYSLGQWQSFAFGPTASVDRPSSLIASAPAVLMPDATWANPATDQGETSGMKTVRTGLSVSTPENGHHYRQQMRTPVHHDDVPTGLTPVPEPSSIAMLAAFAFALIVSRRLIKR